MSQGPPVLLKHFTKPWRDYSDQVQIFQSRGLTVSDPDSAAAFLSHVNYYRLSGYGLGLEKPRHQFIPGATFEQIRATYQFDFQIRDLLSEALELVEIDLRTAIAHHFGEIHGPFGHTQTSNFSKSGHNQNWLEKLEEEINRSKEPFVKHFQNTYQEFPALPIWVATEIMSFGTLSKMYSAMLKGDQKIIAARYGLQSYILENWMHHFVYIRNLCAHHSRVWDRIWSIMPVLPPGKPWGAKELSGNKRLACTLLILYQMLLKCPEIKPFALEWKARVETSVENPPPIPNALYYMGCHIPLSANTLWMASSSPNENKGSN